MMNARSAGVLAMLTLLAYCEHTDSKGLCEFTAMFPSSEIHKCFKDARKGFQMTNCPFGDRKSFLNVDCSEKCTCQDDQLNCDANYSCNSNAECELLDGVRQCSCNEGYVGDGETCSPLYIDCYDAYQAGHTENGLYTIFPSGWPGLPFNVSCVMSTSTHGGGWTVFQRRIDGVTDFYRDWDSYRYGFGSLDGDFWLGNEQLHYLTNQKNYKIRIDLNTLGGSPKYAEYSSFRVSNNSLQFRVDSLGIYSGSAKDGMSRTQERAFSTYDQDNDACSNYACAEQHRGAWWYTSDWCDKCISTGEDISSDCSNFQYRDTCSGECTYSNLNGEYNGSYGEGIFWYDAHVCNINYVEMKIIPS